MKVLVAIKRVADVNVVVRPNSEGNDVELTNVKMAINPFCEIAVEEAVRLKESGVATEVVAVCIGPAKAQEQIRAAMAIGADRGVIVETDENLEPLAIAKCLKAVYDQELPQLIMFGKQSVDGDNNQTGQMFAALAGIPQGTFASALVVADGKATVTREIDGGAQTVELSLPAAVTADLRLNEPRYASLPQIMKAKKKSIETIPFASLGVDGTPRLKVVTVSTPDKRRAGTKVSSVEELVDKLRSEAKVI
ncbi:electron transfer flavoprotein subunit beta/FixA family protein [Marinimicrobium sp. ABcell2]|uniref:electron transfer flavoprotein subunit beta/FixA family protein n=1 Tax=Marinimicrobium sp. ABcell2 TaxID=3069751 RepID=UPI0027B3892B|nr:electron transfer flavoprotein subunit beta/FixA family protein [Marinimicrobium sp. ABcell2]MDQ2078032.1 electron transfer flavoprotein subunit beta/FixA family protein [Marinimicrobium sp. ABcell2]